MLPLPLHAAATPHTAHGARGIHADPSMLHLCALRYHALRPPPPPSSAAPSLPPRWEALPLGLAGYFSTSQTEEGVHIATIEWVYSGDNADELEAIVTPVLSSPFAIGDSISINYFSSLAEYSATAYNQGGLYYRKFVFNSLIPPVQVSWAGEGVGVGRAGGERGDGWWVGWGGGGGGGGGGRGVGHHLTHT